MYISFNPKVHFLLSSYKYQSSIKYSGLMLLMSKLTRKDSKITAAYFNCCFQIYDCPLFRQPYVQTALCSEVLLMYKENIEGVSERRCVTINSMQTTGLKLIYSSKNQSCNNNTFEMGLSLCTYFLYFFSVFV